jgi:putative restriction endonuclease
MTDARALLADLVDRPLRTISGRPNRIVEIADDSVLVATDRSPGGQPVPIAWVQNALDLLDANGEVRIDVSTVGHRSAFIGAVLREVPGAEARSNPQRVIVSNGSAVASGRAVELARRQQLWTRLQVEDDPVGARPSLLAEIRLYRGARGIWFDATETQGAVQGGATVSVLHTGRHYPDDMSEDAALYHYPRTRTPGRDSSEIEATKNCGRLRLPLFVITETGPGGRLRRVRQAWIEGWDDDTEQFLMTFRADEAPPPAKGSDDDATFDLLAPPGPETHRLVRTRPNQQRFRIQTLARYGAQCALCDVTALELLKAAHLVPVKHKGGYDARNGLVLCGNHHDALDRRLVGINPEHAQIVARGRYTLDELGVVRSNLSHLPAQPHAEALRTYWDLSS